MKHTTALTVLALAASAALAADNTHKKDEHGHDAHAHGVDMAVIEAQTPRWTKTPKARAMVRNRPATCPSKAAATPVCL